MKKIICFVKTPGLSPLKTRLAAGIGKRQAEKFYLLSIDAIKQTLNELRSEGFDPIFAVAEKEALDHSLWSEFKTVWQGNGDLGDRLQKVFESEYVDGSHIYFMGGDCPQFECDDIKAVDKHLSEANFSLSPSEDGGYWLFAANCRIKSSIWTSVEYSVQDTYKQFKSLLEKSGRVVEGRMYRDVDYSEDLLALKSSLDDKKALSTKKASLLAWLTLVVADLERPANS